MNDIHDIKFPISPELSYLPLYLIAGIALACVFALAVYVLYKKFQANHSLGVAAKEEPQVDWKREALLKLEKLYPYIQEGKFDEYFLGASAVVKEYLGHAHNINAMEMTAEEIIRCVLEIHKLSAGNAYMRSLQNDANLLQEFFNLCYRYEFAGIEWQKRDAETVFSLAKEIIQRK